MQKFSISEALSNGWKIFKANVVLLIGILLVNGVVGYVPTVIQEKWKGGQLEPVIAVGLFIVFVVFGQFIELGVAKISLWLVDGKKVKFNDLFSCGHLLLKGFMGALIYGIVVMIGIICFVVPGVILGIRLQFYRYLIVDKGMGQIEALTTSWQMTKGSFWNLLGLAIVLIVVNILGALLLVVGLLVTAPLSVLATAEVYRKLEAKQA